VVVRLHARAVALVLAIGIPVLAPIALGAYALLVGVGWVASHFSARVRWVGWSLAVSAFLLSGLTAMWGRASSGASSS